MFVPTASAAVTDLPEASSGIGSGLLNTSMQIGASIAIAGLTTLSVSIFNSHLHGSVTDPTVVRQALAAGFTGGLKVSAAIVAVNFLTAAFVLPRRRTAGSDARPAFSTITPTAEPAAD
jgi:hypothetical protein